LAGRVSKERIITGALLILLCAAAIILGGWFALICAYIGLLATALDALRAFKAAGYKVLWPVVLATAVLMLPAYKILELTGVCILLAISVVLTLCAAVFVRKSDFLDVMLTLFLLMYPVLPASMLLFIACGSNQDMTQVFLAMTLILPSACDSMAYFMGISLGKKKLCPEISPKKTVAGCIGAFLGGTFFGLIMGLIVNKFFWQGIPLEHYVVIGFASGFFSQVGDLSASMLKRFCGIKDFGKYLPGHGGALDRLDSIIVNAVLIFIYSRIMSYLI